MSQITSGHHLIRKKFRPRNVFFSSVGLRVLVHAFCAYLYACTRARARTLTFTHVRIRRRSVTVVGMLRAERPRNRGLISGWSEEAAALMLATITAAHIFNPLTL